MHAPVGVCRCARTPSFHGVFSVRAPAGIHCALFSTGVCCAFSTGVPVGVARVVGSLYGAFSTVIFH